MNIRKGKFRSEKGVMLLGVDLRDAREEVFCRMVCDGISLGVAFSRAGFTSKAKDAPYNLWHLPRVQERANAILDARRATGVVTLGEVTDMLKRVFAGASASEEFSAAHNAAFSLARLYGHVTDRATVEVIRRPSRDPEAPSEQALASWVEALPALPGPGPAAFGQPSEALREASFVRLAEAPAPPLGFQTAPEPQSLNEINDLAPTGPGPGSPQPSPSPEARSEFSNEINWLGAAGPQGPGPQRDFSNEINDLAAPPTRGRSENGAPVAAVTVTPQKGGRSEPLEQGVSRVPPAPGDTKKRVPLKRKRVPAPAGKKPVFRRTVIPDIFK